MTTTPEPKKNQVATTPEAQIYAVWEKSGVFQSSPDSKADPYTIMMPPPNVTGSLHVGHALTMTLQDILIRWQRMSGKDALWMPGTDHAGIATQMMVERQVNDEGTTSKQLGREAFIKRIWQWKEESGGAITKQLRRLGASPDWSRERFTMDEQSSNAVQDAFIKLYEQKKIYRDLRLVNWDPVFQSALSDLEVKNQETAGSLWYINYPVEGKKNKFITVATTRPETMLGDTAVAVHPDDERYKDLIGANVVLPLTGRLIPIVADSYSDMEKGSGAVKITPAHDFNDFEVGKRHKLPMPSILDAQAKIKLDEIESELRDVDGITSIAFVKGLLGKDRFVARKEIVAELTKLNLLDKIDKHTSAVPHADRGGAVIEPRLTPQWYCDVKDMADAAIKSVKTGEIKFVQEEWENTFFSWLSDIQPWCISRQLWWGHRIPAWYGPDGKVFVAKSEADAMADATKHYGQTTELTQDNDVLDTWFSSGLWPFSTLGWPAKTKEMDHYYPTSVLITGFDIIFFWVARMIMMGLYLTGKPPFKTVYIHGLVRDEHGQKMSKTKGNVIDPLTLIDEFGADALRWAICSETSTGRDISLGKSHLETSKKFITKLRNAIGFFKHNGLTPQHQIDIENIKTPLCRWLLAKTNLAIAESTKYLTNFRYDEYAGALYKYIWNDLCDWFIEFSKSSLRGDDAKEILSTANYTLNVILRLLHPVMPFVTEELWKDLEFGAMGTLIKKEWPQTIAVSDEKDVLQEVGFIMKLISTIRNIRAEMNVPHTAKVPLTFVKPDAASTKRAETWKAAIQRLANIGDIESTQEESTTVGGVQEVVDGQIIILKLSDVIDLQAEQKRLSDKYDNIAGYIKGTEAKLQNEGFVSKAPANIVQGLRDQLAEKKVEAEKLQQVIQRITSAEIF